MKSTASSITLLLLTSFLLISCGGGSGGNAVPTPGSSVTTPPPSTPSTPGQSTGACLASSANEIWIDKRLGCLAVGQSVIDISSSTASSIASYSFVVRQSVLGASFNSVLGASRDRYFSRILCVKNAPTKLSSSFLLSLASDLVVATRASGNYPAGYSTFMTIDGGNQERFVQESCDSTKHPIIIDFSTKKIESINLAALPSVTIYDL